jgi:hypothetical protein
MGKGLPGRRCLISSRCIIRPGMFWCWRDHTRAMAPSDAFARCRRWGVRDAISTFLTLVPNGSCRSNLYGRPGASLPGMRRGQASKPQLLRRPAVCPLPVVLLAGSRIAEPPCRHRGKRQDADMLPRNTALLK